MNNKNQNEENKTNEKDNQFETETIPLSNGQPILQKDLVQKNKLAFFITIFIAIIVIAGGGYWTWNNYLSPHARDAKRIQNQYEKYLELQEKYEDAMKDDTYGGTTPQETLDMFVDALKKGDLELASKYFVLREDGSNDTKWIEALSKKSKTDIEYMIEILKTAAPKTGDAISDEDFKFASHDKNGKLTAYINMQLNTYSKIWKIESL